MSSRQPFASWFSNEKKKHVSQSYKTIQELRKNLKSIFEDALPWRVDYYGSTVNITRYRRGEWGEWFEIWEKSDNKIRRVKQGWM